MTPALTSASRRSCWRRWPPAQPLRKPRAAVPSQPSSVAAWTREVLAPVAQRFEARAQQGYTRCLQRAELTHAFDASARACLARAAALDPSHPAEELFASAPLLYSRAVGARPAEQPPPAP